MALLRVGSVVLLAALLGTGCALVSGLSSLDVGSSDGGASNDASIDTKTDARDGGLFDGAPPPPVDGGCSCLGSIPAGFAPALFGQVDAKCPKELQDDSVFVGPQTLTASGACTCGCSMSGCAGGAMRFFDTTGCGGQLGNFTPNGGCQNNGVGNVGGVSSMRWVQPGAPTCVVGAASFPSASTGKSRLCSGDSGAASCTAVCQTSALAACIVAPGDVACPAGMTKQVVAASITDARTCTGCTCNVAPQATCMLALQFYSDVSCSVASGVPYNVLAEDCTTTTIPSTNVIAKATPVGSCNAINGIASGTTTPVGVRTVCCK